MESLHHLSLRLNNSFNLVRSFTRVDDKMDCCTFPFISPVHKDFSHLNPKGSNSGSALTHDIIEENCQFRYSLFKPADSKPADSGIVLLHGLNERHWEKYLPWAYTLALKTGKPVILFPIAHHMNRAPATWGLPRAMQTLKTAREKMHGPIAHSTYANVAISSRLDILPELFIHSGLQSLSDIIALTRQIEEGKHNLFRRGATLSFFSYSIGAFITEILLMANPLNLFSQSKAFFFCGGATFDQMDARSKSILDDRAFNALSHFILDDENLQRPPKKTPKSIHPVLSSLWQAFLSLLTLDRQRAYREEKLGILAGRIDAVGLKSDRVISGDAIEQTLGSLPGVKTSVSIENFNYPYSHEVPFPLSNTELINRVDRAFTGLFNRAGAFLA